MISVPLPGLELAGEITSSLSVPHEWIRKYAGAFMYVSNKQIGEEAAALAHDSSPRAAATVGTIVR